jgi:hypothetical protein
MANVPAPNRSFVAWLFVAGGVLQVIAVALLLGNAGDVNALWAISNLTLGVGFVLMAAWLSRAMISVLAYIIAAIGWLLLALTSIVNLGFFGSIAVFIAIVGSLFAGVVVYTSHPFTPNADRLFLIAMIAAAINLLVSQNGNVPPLLKDLIVITFGGLLVAAGFLILRKR